MLAAALLLLFQTAPAETLTDAQIAELGKHYDKSWPPKHWTETIGIHHGTPVIADYHCSDLCPDYLTRVIHYDVAPGAACERIGGVMREARIPDGIGANTQRFCVPAVLGSWPIPLGGG